MIFAQFHDYIPGSSIPEVYAEGVPELVRMAQELAVAAGRELASANREAVGVPCLFNPLAIPRDVLTNEGLMRLPPLGGVAIASATARRIPPSSLEITLSQTIISSCGSMRWGAR